ncbi:type IV pilus assembly protein PilZ [Gottschalkia acidurici 9a]|uniref:Type IV pilus assembly protein PilZ n=1 Tax=Gottschalkia acidurici (strain ATCC 7906 / DSM 604 / BCRC 14475 / CIP 104303 / KCTC 5404 / NCIMB 10678 / 9a) TaxID=1128398 RepID=K0B300_GOTA9|nr:flagellar brake protein [Gottschalkia acidurici]AFS79552.1 type IV pilus assembly protein PilZ [Gottschalkia acidurici 9a]
MDTSILKIGSKVIINKKVKSDENDYISQIENVEGDKIKILTPMYKSTLIRLHEGTNIGLMVFSDLGVYKLDAEVGGTIVDKLLHYTELKATSKVAKFERRDHFRLKIMKDVLVRKNDENEEMEYAKCLTIDLSGGGIQFSSTEKFEENDVVEMRIDMDDEEMVLKGKILSVVKQESVGNYKYGTKFVDIRESIREKVIRYIFKVQREKLNIDII